MTDIIRFNTLRNYTPLKPLTCEAGSYSRFNTLRNYTPLKPHVPFLRLLFSFNTLRNYTPLKLIPLLLGRLVVLTPFVITHLSNRLQLEKRLNIVLTPFVITHLSNPKYCGFLAFHTINARCG